MEEYKLEENEKIIAEFEITKEGTECFVAGVLVTLFFIMMLWTLETYSHINWS